MRGCERSAAGFVLPSPGPGPLEVYVGRRVKAKFVSLCAKHLAAASANSGEFRAELLKSLRGD